MTLAISRSDLGIKNAGELAFSGYIGSNNSVINAG